MFFDRLIAAALMCQLWSVTRHPDKKQHCGASEWSHLPHVFMWSVFLPAGWREVSRVHPQERSDSVHSLLLASQEPR